MPHRLGGLAGGGRGGDMRDRSISNIDDRCSNGPGPGSNSLNRQDNNMLYTPQQRGGYMQNQPIQHGNGWNSQNRGNLDMPNLQALGINPQGQNPSNQGQNMNNPLGVGLNLNSLPMNPAIVAAALNQWGLIGNIQNQDQVNITFLILTFA